MQQLKITTIGNSVGVILPKELLALLNVGKGDTLTVSRTADGIVLRPYDDKFARQMDAGRKVMRENRDALKRLAE
jgi:putative addiction module antidote